VANLLRAEGRKLIRSALWLPVLASPLLAVAWAVVAGPARAPAGHLAWATLFHVAAFPYALLFLPLAVGVMAATACQVEHSAGGWTQMAALPVSRLGVYAAKFAWVLAAVFVSEALFVAGGLLDGLVLGAVGPVPWADVCATAALGGAACIPIAALQLWVGTVWESFGAQFAVSAILTIPAFIGLHHGAALWYPWDQPALVMLGIAHGQATVAVVAGYGTLLLAVGATHFVRRDWAG